jgi:hypothetical protein
VLNPGYEKTPDSDEEPARNGIWEKRSLSNVRSLLLKRHAQEAEKTLRIGLKFHPKDFKLLNGTFIIVLSPFQNSSWGTKDEKQCR